MKPISLLLLISLHLPPIYAAPSPLQMIEAEIENPPRPLSKETLVIAIIDTGFDSDDSRLKKSLWENPGETGTDKNGNPKGTNGLDDDGNGFVDDVHGWNFVSNTPNTKDAHGHGTHIAGIIDQVVRESPKSSPPPIRYMILKYYDTDLTAQRTLINTVKAFDYAVRNGAQIINFSGGGLQPDAAEREALVRAEAANVLVVAAAGNDGLNTDHSGYYPANYPLSNILSVGGVDARMRRVPSSNYGTHSVTLSAPGENIRSFLPHDKVGFMTGTSQATAFATGVAAMTLMARPDLGRPKGLIEHLVQTSLPSQNLKGSSRSGSVVNLKRSLSLASEGELADGTHIANYSTFVEKAILNLSAPDEDVSALKIVVPKP